MRDVGLEDELNVVTGAGEDRQDATQCHTGRQVDLETIRSTEISYMIITASGAL